MKRDLPVRRWELDQARLGVCGAVRQCVAQGDTLPPLVVAAWEVLGDLEQRVRDHEAVQRAEHLAIPMHYVAHPGDKRTLCDLTVKDVSSGFVGVRNEFLNRRLEAGGLVCETCRERA